VVPLILVLTLLQVLQIVGVVLVEGQGLRVVKEAFLLEGKGFRLVGMAGQLVVGLLLVETLVAQQQEQMLLLGLWVVQVVGQEFQFD